VLNSAINKKRLSLRTHIKCLTAAVKQYVLVKNQTPENMAYELHPKKLYAKRNRLSNTKTCKIRKASLYSLVFPFSDFTISGL